MTSTLHRPMYGDTQSRLLAVASSVSSYEIIHAWRPTITERAYADASHIASLFVVSSPHVSGLDGPHMMASISVLANTWAYLTMKQNPTRTVFIHETWATCLTSAAVPSTLEDLRRRYCRVLPNIRLAPMCAAVNSCTHMCVTNV